VNQLTFWGLIGGLVAVAAYVCVAVKHAQKAQLNDAALIFISAFAITGAIRLLAFALSGTFNALLKKSTEENWSSAAPEDAAFIVLGGLALAWVSFEGMYGPFKAILKPTAGTGSGAGTGAGGGGGGGGNGSGSSLGAAVPADPKTAAENPSVKA